MKLKEYIRLGKISIKSRKKSTKNTVRGISFGLIMLIPVVFFTLAFNVDMTNKINDTRNISIVNVLTHGEGAESATVQLGDNSNSPIVFGASDMARITERTDAVEEVVYADYWAFGSDRSNTNGYAIIDEQMMQYSEITGNGNYGGQINYSDILMPNLNVKVVDITRSGGKTVPAGIVEDLEEAGKTVLSAGEGFSEEGGKGEVMISELVLQKYGIDPSEAIGKEFSLLSQLSFNEPHYYNQEYVSGYFLDNDTNPNNSYSVSEDGVVPNFGAAVIAKFEIVGIISNEYFSLNSALFHEPQVWITDASVYQTAGGERTVKYLPELKTHSKESTSGSTSNYQIVTYPEAGEEGVMNLMQQAAEEKMFFPAVPAMTPWCGGEFYVWDAYFEAPVTMASVQCKDYDGASTVVGIIDGVYTNLTGEDSSDMGMGGYATSYCAVEAFENFSMLHTIGGYVMVVMYVFGGIIFFATLLNLYNSVNYSVQARRNYIGMMRAIGATKDVIPRLYLVEILLIFARSLIWVLIFSGGISYGIKALIDMLFKSEASMLLGTTLSLNFGYFFLALGVVFVLIFAIAFIFSRVACLSVTRKGILEVLSDDK
ncbi:MAG: hypothetical protein J6C93_06010 [Clostridia bacterium]|nr:hypothetical protein [Clostridia bacterium]